MFACLVLIYRWKVCLLLMLRSWWIEWVYMGFDCIFVDRDYKVMFL